MTDQEKIAAILQAIQNDTKLLMLLRASATKNLPNVSSEQLEALMQALGLYNT